jgi:ABC-2 type transport system ATP-binding protein
MICVKNLIKNYRNIQALKGVSFNINSGEVFGYIGPNGSGKTTTIRAVCGLIRPNSGSIEILGTDALRKFGKIGHKIGVVMENSGLYPSLTAVENLEFFDRLFSDNKSKRCIRIEEALEMVELTDRKNCLIKTYSKGMQRRLSMARAILAQPKILMLDEPFDGIDVESRHTLIKILKQWVQKPERCIFMTSHNMADIESVCTSLAIIKKGEIIAHDTINNLGNRSGVINIEVIFIELPEERIINDILKNIQSIVSYSIDVNTVFIKSKDYQIGSELASRFLNLGLKFAEIKNKRESIEEFYLRMVGKQ